MPKLKKLIKQGVSGGNKRRKGGTRSRKKSTRYIVVDSSRCKACWDCIDKCECGVLGRLNIWFHKHVIMKDGEACCGCRKCIAVCPNGVFSPAARSRKV